MDGRVAVMVRLADDAAVDRQSFVIERANPWDSGVGADERIDVVLLEPAGQSRGLELRFPEELVGLIGAAVAQQHALTGQVEDALRRPGGQPVSIRIGQRFGGQRERQAGDALIFGRGVAAPACCRAPGGLLFMITGNHDIALRSNEFKRFPAVRAASDGIAEKRDCVATLRPGIVKAGV